MATKKFKEWLNNPFLRKDVVIQNKIYLKETIKLCKSSNLIKEFKYDKDIVYKWDKFYSVLKTFLEQFESSENWNKVNLHITKIDSNEKTICAMYDYNTETIILNYNVLVSENPNNILMSINHEYVHYLDHFLNKNQYKNFISNEPYSTDNIKNNKNTPSLFIKSFIAGDNIKSIKNKYTEKDFTESLLIYSLVNKSEKLLNKINQNFIDETMFYLFEILLKEQKYLHFNIMKYLNETLEKQKSEELISYQLSEIEKEYDRTKYRILKKLKIEKVYDKSHERNLLILPKHENDFYNFLSYLIEKSKSEGFDKEERRELIINTYYNLIYFNINKIYDFKDLNIYQTDGSNIFAFYNLITMNGNHYTEFLSPYLLKNINNKNVDFNYITNIPELLAYSIEANPNNLIYTFADATFNYKKNFDDSYEKPSYTKKETKIKKNITFSIRGFIEKYNLRNFTYKENFKQNQLNLFKEEMSLLKRDVLNKLTKKASNEGTNPFENHLEKTLLEKNIKNIRKNKIHK